jgi:hypothetical protein
MTYKFRAVHPISGIKYFTMYQIDGGSLLFDDGDWRCINECEIEQFTGCFDKDNKELYFNDIIEIKKHYEGDCLIPTLKYKIIWDPPFFMSLNGDDNYSEIDYSNQQNITLLGNIHENEELLK